MHPRNGIGADMDGIGQPVFQDRVGRKIGKEFVDIAFAFARLHGIAPAKAAKMGCKLAAVVIRHPGAIIPLAAMPKIALGKS